MATKVIKGQKHVSCAERLRELHQFSLEEAVQNLSLQKNTISRPETKDISVQILSNTFTGMILDKAFNNVISLCCFLWAN